MGTITTDRIFLGRSGVCPRMSQLPNGEGVDLLPGTPVASFNGMMVRAAAISEALVNVAGIITAACQPTLPTRAAFYGIVECSTDEWDLVTGEIGGLVPDATYFLSIVAGMISTSPPTEPGQFVVDLGKALDSVTFLLGVQQPILL